MRNYTVKRYRKLWIVALIFCVIPSVVLLAIRMSSNKEDRDINPIKYSKRVIIESQGRKNFYYHLDASSSLSVVINGPVLLRVITRLDFSERSKKSAPYTVYLSADENSPMIYNKKSKVSSLSKYISSTEKNFPGRIRIIFIKVPQGKHTYTLSLDKDAKYALKVRFILRQKGTSNKNRAKLTPDKSDQFIQLKTGKNSSGYYLVNKNNPLSFTAEGHNQAKIITRLVMQG